MQKKSLIPLLLIGFFCTAIPVAAQMTRAEYIEKYKDIAISQMYKYNIPASIILAQGCLESGNGNSSLALEANNHFGIKCHQWEGDSILHDDDALQECFRKYANARDSYRDHSEFLKTRPRYQSLFSLGREDYENWAIGLKAAGYATNPKYAQMLIDIIESNKLYQYDTAPLPQGLDQQAVLDSIENTTTFKQEHENYEGLYILTIGRTINKVNNRRYILSEPGDTYASLAEEYQLFTKEITSFNDVSLHAHLPVGERVYLERKAKVSAKGNLTHTVGRGETLHSLSQRYAIQENALRLRNNLTKKQTIQEGDVLRLR